MFELFLTYIIESSHDLLLTLPKAPAAAPAHRATVSFQSSFLLGLASPQLGTTSGLAIDTLLGPVPGSLEEQINDLAHRAGYFDNDILIALRREGHWIPTDIDLLLPIGSLMDDQLLHKASEHSVSTTHFDHCLLSMLFFLVSNNLIQSWHGDFWNVLRRSGIMQLDCDSHLQRYSPSAIQATMHRIFEEAVHWGHIDIVSWLLDVYNQSPDMRVCTHSLSDTGTHLPLVVVMSGAFSADKRAGLVKLLLSRGASLLKVCCNKHQTPFQYAVAEGNSEILEAITSSKSASPAAGHQCDLVGPVFEIQDDTLEEWLDPEVYSPSACDTDDGHSLAVDLVRSLNPTDPAQKGPSFWLSSPDVAIRAAKSNNHGLLREIYRHGLPMDCHNESGDYPLAMAICSVETTRLLLSLGASPDYCTDKKAPALHCAIQDSPIETCMAVCKILIENGAGVNTIFEYKRTLDEADELLNCLLSVEYPESVLTEYTDDYAPLDVAIHETLSDLFLIRFLIDHGAEINIGNLLQILHDLQDLENLERLADEYGSDPLDNMPSIIKLFLEKGFDLKMDSRERGRTILDLVIELCHPGTLKVVMDAGVTMTSDVALSACDSGLFRTSAYLYQAIPSGLKCRYDSALLTIVTAIGQQNVKQLKEGLSNFQTAGPHDREDVVYLLSLSLRNGDCQVVHLILQSFPQVYDSYALCIAIVLLQRQPSLYDVVDEMLKRRKIGPMDKEHEVRALHLSVRHALHTDDFRVVEHFCQNDRFWESPSSPKFTVIPREHWTTALNECRHLGTGSPEQLQRLIKLGLVPSTLLFLQLAEYGKLEHLEVLLAHGFDPNNRYPWSPTALQLAVGSSGARGMRIPIIRLLLEYGADASCSAIRHCAPQNAFKHIQCLHWKSDRDVFQSAVEQGNADLLKLLLTYGADVNGPAGRRDGATALQIACIKGYTLVVQFLLSRKVDIDAPGGHYRGRTALEAAAENGRLDIIRLLLSAGSQLSGSYRKQYVRAVGFAQIRAREDVARELKEIGQWQPEDDVLLSKENLSDVQTPSLFREWEDTCILCSGDHGNGHAVSCNIPEDCELSYAPTCPGPLTTSFWPSQVMVGLDEECWMSIQREGNMFREWPEESQVL